MFVHATITAKVESAPGGDAQYMFHFTLKIGWNGIESDDNGPGFAMRVPADVFTRYQIGDVIKMQAPDA